jgi:hypothetical protein
MFAQIAKNKPLVNKNKFHFKENLDIKAWVVFLSPKAKESSRKL